MSGIHSISFFNLSFFILEITLLWTSTYAAARTDQRLSLQVNAHMNNQKYVYKNIRMFLYLEQCQVYDLAQQEVSL